ncbi:MAG: hypothetical protein BWX51_01968 [Bacteroidetes bacterium ADurb.Bin012]|nr:MAG: hypothetical protein BWX51_01968 [Bacteroidetes bacterium ADurb.Bin012]
MMAITIEREYISIFIVSNLLFRTYARDDAISIIGRHWLNNSRGIKSGKKSACFQTVEAIILKTISIHIRVLVLRKPFYHGYIAIITACSQTTGISGHIVVVKFHGKYIVGAFVRIIYGSKPATSIVMV